MKIIATIEARMNSSRLPGKILKEVCQKPILQHIYERAKRATKVHQVAIITTLNPLDNATEAFCQKNNFDFFRGSEDNVLDRLISAGDYFQTDYIMQLTGDCPFVEPRLIDHCIDLYFDQNQKPRFDYFSNRLRPTFPTGLDVQIYPLHVLKKVADLTQDPTDQEHGAFYIYNHPEIFKLGTFTSNNLKCPEKRWVLDYPEDFEFTKVVYEALYEKNPHFDHYDILRFLEKNPEVEKINDMHSLIIKNYI